MDKRITYKPFGNKAILIEWSAVINTAILYDILDFKLKIEHQKEIEFYDLVVGYNSLTIKLKRPFNDFKVIVKYLEFINTSTVNIVKKDNFLWEIPVCYDPTFGIDLEDIALRKKTTIDNIITLHIKKTYTVFFIGFLPGFLYLGGLDECLFVNRKPTPRLNVDKGAVAIGGKQTGIYPINSPGGWNIIGKTPISFFNAKADKPCFVSAGDQIKFKPISIDEFALLEIEVEENLYQISKTLLE
ncbi:allophanate hydrolase subunit 1 [Polaribacter sp. WD7]|uniref:5-oxoprolinase subunit PxpB n=1 Tax=Polaribacter sp. WD7 TaxID=2269061 RepID=UPI000DF3C96A|nr:5-oxoprolinase subunit PxpB [Polaribacter sp. WD7]RCS26397.1 allophanate hydrolase subunit 1 [Polaribacter sp. WD7]